MLDRIFAALKGKSSKPQRIMIDATHLKAHSKAASLLKKGIVSTILGAPKVASIQNSIQSATKKESLYACFFQKAR